MIDRFTRHHLRKVRVIAEHQFGLVDRRRIFSIDMLESRDRHRPTEIKDDEGLGTFAVGRVLALRAIIDEMPDDKVLAGYSSAQLMILVRGGA